MSNTINATTGIKGFKDIALCFSGGGYRAACFSLGTLSFLEKISLLESVKTISTVSGGTITGVKWAQSQTDGESFEKFFSDYYNWLKKDELTNRAIGHIKRSKEWNLPGNEHKKRNPINAFALEYNKLVSHRTLGDVHEAIKNGKTSFNKVMFNTTDFSHSTGFKFQNITTGSILGNKKIQKLGHSLNDHISEFKLGDILAASSAFPGGFEPISFPNDFVPKNTRKRMGIDKMDEIGLMDGGITDNQGISSILSGRKDYDLFFIADVASPYDKNPFKFSDKNLIIRFLNILANPLVFIVTVVLFSFSIYFNWSRWVYSVLLILTTLTFALQFLFLYINSLIKKKTGILEKFRILPRKFGFYIFNRINSVLKMTSQVFLKNTRRSNYSSIYSKFYSRISTATIYLLRCDNDEGKPENQNDWDKIRKITRDIPDYMKKISEYASSFETTLWFSKKDKNKGMLDAVIACGEFTACFSLIAHLIRNHEEDIKSGGNLNPLYQNTLSLWEKFHDDPYFLLAERISNEKLHRYNG